MSKQDFMQIDGIITDILHGGQFKVQVNCENTTKEIICHVSGKIRTNHIKLVKGDEVIVEMSSYDLTKGRISYRK